jgi:hypothetical protein
MVIGMYLRNFKITFHRRIQVIFLSKSAQFIYSLCSILGFFLADGQVTKNLDVVWLQAQASKVKT